MKLVELDGWTPGMEKPMVFKIKICFFWFLGFYCFMVLWFLGFNIES